LGPFRPPEDADFGNPYAPPKSTFEPEPSVPSRTPSIPFSIDGIVSASWSIFRDNLGKCLWVFWGWFLMYLGLIMLLQQLLNRLEDAMPGRASEFQFISLAFRLVFSLIQAWIGIGLTLAFIKIVRGEPVSIGILFSGGRYLLRVILASIVAALLLVAAVLIPFVVMNVAFALFQNQMGTGLLLLIASIVVIFFLILYLAARLMQFSYLILDRGAGVIESIQLSWRLTRGRAGTIILVYCMHLILVIGGLLAFCVGVIFTVPLGSLMQVVTFLAMAGPLRPPERRPPTSAEEQSGWLKPDNFEPLSD
jgi:hypothetical protein